MSLARYLRTLETHGIDGAVRGSIAATVTFGAATVAVHTNVQTPWNWQTDADARELTALVFLLRGTASVRAAGPGEHELATGDAFLIHSRRRAEVLWSAGAGCLVLLLPTDSIVGSGVDVQSLPLTFERTPLLAATREFASALCRERGVSARFSEYVSERLLAEMAFGLVLEGRETGRDTGRELARGSLADRARTIMLVRRAEPDLSAASIAADLHVSVRQLQRAFASEDSSPAAALRSLRADLAQSMLRDPQYDGLSVDQVAQYSGFASTSVLRRAFDAEGMTAPSVVRRTREQVAI